MDFTYQFFTVFGLYSNTSTSEIKLITNSYSLDSQIKVSIKLYIV